MDVTLVSLAVDELPFLEQDAARLEISSRFASDFGGEVTSSYGIPPTFGGEPGHTFVLVTKDGKIGWFKDYADARAGPVVMYVDPDELYSEVHSALGVTER